MHHPVVFLGVAVEEVGVMLGEQVLDRVEIRLRLVAKNELVAGDRVDPHAVMHHVPFLAERITHVLQPEHPQRGLERHNGPRPPRKIEEVLRRQRESPVAENAMIPKLQHGILHELARRTVMRQQTVERGKSPPL